MVIVWSQQRGARMKIEEWSKRHNIENAVDIPGSQNLTGAIEIFFTCEKAFMLFCLEFQHVASDRFDPLVFRMPAES